ncbi:MAG TPA: 2-phospho-L-lactate transferase [Anaerolineae bacterium]|nr:2-phospho-L-lactate transferase [Anaerolineae bacterium]
MNIVALAGGVGGAKLAHGLTLTPAPLSLSGRRDRGEGKSLTIIVNTGDDFELYGLHISPDLDTVIYTLAGLANPDTGWGLAGDTFQFLDALKRLGVEMWFRIGDRDLATHIRRTELLRQGKTLTEATQLITQSLGITSMILPMTDDRFRTMLNTDQGRLEFQEYFVHRQWQPRIQSIEFDGASTARLTQPAADAIQVADAIIICPSNPFVSIDPILTLTPAPLSLKRRRDGGENIPIVAVSPIVGGQAIKGPAAKMFEELGLEPAALNVAKHYQGLVTHFVLDQIDASQESAIQLLGMRTFVTDTLMKSIDDRVRLANEVISFISNT